MVGFFLLHYAHLYKSHLHRLVAAWQSGRLHVSMDGHDFRCASWGSPGSWHPCEIDLSREPSCSLLHTRHSHSGAGNMVEHMQPDAQANAAFSWHSKADHNADLCQVCMLLSNTQDCAMAFLTISAHVATDTVLSGIQGPGRSRSSSGLPALWPEHWEAVCAASIRSASPCSVQNVNAT